MPTCLTTDVVGSKEHPDRAATQEALLAALDQVNRDFAAVLLVPLSITVGDEWQGLVGRLDDAFRVDFAVRRLLHPIRVRSGIGTGEVITPTRERTALMDGPCFHRSREALEAAKHRRGSTTRVMTGLDWIDDYLNAQERVLLAAIDDWTDTQFATAMAFRDEGTEPAAAQRLGVAQPTVHKSLAGANAKEVLQAIEARNQFLRRVEAEWLQGAER